MSDKLSLDDVLELKHINDWEWSPTGNQLAYIWDNGGRYKLWVVDADGSSEPRLVSKPEKGVTSFDWHPTSGGIIFAQDGNLWRAQPNGSTYNLEQLTDTNGKESTPTWNPEDNLFAFIRADTLWLRDMETGFEREVAFPGRVITATFGPEPPLSWSPDGSLLACRFVDEAMQFQLGVCDCRGTVLWRTTVQAANAGGAAWVNEDTLLYVVSRELDTCRDFYLAAFDGSEAEVMEDWIESEVAFSPVGPVEIEHVYRQQDEECRGTLHVSGAHPNPEGTVILFTLENDGWAHHYLYDRESGGLEQLTFGECEDYGHAGDEPQWAPDGKSFVYASNRTDSAQRELWRFDLETRENTRLTDFPGTNVQPKWSPEGDRIAFIHCDPWHSMDLWCLNVDEEDTEPFQLTDSMPDNWTHSKAVVPEEVVFKGADDWDLHGFLVKPADFDPAERYPALVYVHGGPIRQMRYGFHPVHSYSVFYAYHQYLAHQGFASLAVNFRGGTGYGRDFRNGLYHKMGVDDIADVVAAGHYLKELPWVDEDRVGVWGLSYGGYMTLHALTQYPDEFKMGINLAGIWDFAQWTRWVEERWGKFGGLFKVFLGGDPDESPELYRQASPVTFKDNLCRPLINLHGTDDANVDFEQLDRIVKDCVSLGAEYEAYYYPNEAHMFRHRRTWADAFSRIERELNRYLLEE